ncbi:hypothetical protein BDP81DRAFT_91071 [Colletotrichum phormii]|uniref:Uncharacterized protein n=1 Tax=Colletotrichum phormii TaxID=359342 RepID=A0AAJ0A1U8_9PEZI|nr:uncharacterized protein BDP81DRAFT_91071 [Colletotrichum phormii]KAK1654927.1 hypothetical protein BDP81DRAFT_91071 [Colletotrichum phormii]
MGKKGGGESIDERPETENEAQSSRESNKTNTSQSSPSSDLLNQATPQSCRGSESSPGVGSSHHSTTSKTVLNQRSKSLAKTIRFAAAKHPELHLQPSVDSSAEFPYEAKGGFSSNKRVPN